MKNPVMTASGTFGCGREHASFFDLGRLGALVVKSLTLKERMGNAPPRICETPSGILNSIGLQNKGVEGFIKEDLPFLKEFNVPIIANVAGESIDEYVQVCGRLEAEKDIAAVELNISCPNVESGGMMFGQDPEMASLVVGECRKAVSKPLIVKLTPNVTDISQIARRMEDAGADAVSLINTLLGMAIDTKSFQPLLAGTTGGLSGPAIKPVAVRMVWEVAKAVSIPVIGMGGISKAEDAVEFFLAGANAVAIGTANFMEPTSAVKIIQGLETFLEQKGFQSIQDIIGKVKLVPKNR